ncbi:IS1182 family transposase [Ralstonia sp.]|uniref:IS1182 family transposase n=1 Tax=Ralstonia sp. TaxID=54061 RepID=UPI00397C043C
MTRPVREWNVDQSMLLPLSVHDFVPSDHVAHFIRDTVAEELDLSAVWQAYGGDRGQPPYHPAMMTALLLYAYCQGIYASRRIAAACEQRVDFMAVTGMERPDFRTISDFRKQHLQALEGLFVQVLALCQQAGLARLGHVALDGTKVAANASKHKAMSYARLQREEQRLAAEVEGWFEAADAADGEDDAAFGDVRGDELPAWAADRQQRLDRIRAAKEALEAEAAEAAEAETRAASAGDAEDDDDDPDPPSAPPRHHDDGTPADKAQRNFTDPDSRVMLTRSGWMQAYNAQIAVDADHQVIVGQMLTPCAVDINHLAPMVAAIERDAGHVPDELSADAGYCSEANLEYLNRNAIRGYVATGRGHHDQPTATGDRAPDPDSFTGQMETRLRRGGWRSRYRLRKILAEPVIGQIKHARGFRQLLLRGLDQAKGEWSLMCTAHNLMKLAKAAA